VSTLDADVEIATEAVTAMGLEVTPARAAQVGDLTVRRLLPLRQRRSVGAWCFIDHYGPQSVDGVAGMQVPPHPHIGLQTVTWLLAGNVLHRDSIGSEQMIRAGQLNLMTAGRGIAHAEESPAAHDPVLHGVQLWVALPETSRRVAPAFEHHAELPGIRLGGFRASVLMGELAGARSQATTFSPLVGAELTAVAALGGPAVCHVPLDPSFEHVLLAAEGSILVSGVALDPGHLLYVPAGLEQVRLEAPEGSCALLLGGEPLRERLLTWWNFVARTPEEVEAATASWQAGEFGAVGGYRGDPLAAPALDVARLLRRAR
jgi:quercetin 2,3-dioxygenase